MGGAFHGTYSPQCFGFGLDALHTPAGGTGGQWRGDLSCCCRRIPQTAPECLSLFFFFALFHFEKIFLLNPAAPYKEGPILLHSPPLQLDRGLSGSGPHMAQLSTLPRQHPQSLCVYHFIRIPLPVTSSNQVSLGSSLVWQGRELLTWLSPRSPAAGLAGVGLGLQSPWSLRWSKGPFCPVAVPLPSVFSVSSILFGLVSS